MYGPFLGPGLGLSLRDGTLFCRGTAVTTFHEKRNRNALPKENWFLYFGVDA